ncbi:MAG: tetratricopeptide repeat protein [Muribaculaceae bacterium]|nr:tetratricopeptide repeat protein [Muribaculaceae bacterium]
MKFKGIFALCLAGFSMSAFAQSHVEGEEYYKADQFDNAKELLLRSLKNQGTDKAVSSYYLGMIALRNKDKAEAEKYFNQGVEENPEYGYNYIGLGTLALLDGDLKTADVEFKEAEKTAKKDGSLQIAIARAYDMADPVKYQKEIEKRLDNARKRNNENPDIYIFEGDVLARAKKWGDAGAKYEMAGKYNGTASDAYVKYANLFTMVNPDYAIRMLKELLSLNPQSALGQRELANAYYNAKDYKNAAAEYSKYIKNPSHFKQDENRYAFLLFYGGDYKKGYDYATQLLQADPSNFTARRYQFMNAAQLPEMKDQLLEMAEGLFKDHKANPKANKFAAIDYTLIADELAKAKRPDEAIAVLQEGIAEMPDNAGFSKDLAMKYVDQNNLTKAAEAFREYVKKTKEPGYNDYNQQALFSFYAAVENKENPELAKAFFDEVLANANKMEEILPDNYKPKMFKGDVAKQTATTEEEAAIVAQPMYEQAVVLLEQAPDPSKYVRDAKTLYMYLGNCYLHKKNIAKAKEYYNKFLKLDPNNEAVRKYVEGLK